MSNALPTTDAGRKLTSDDARAKAAVPADNDGAEAFAASLAGTNINETTFLATDYLNHFNEVVMLIDLSASMPECMEDVRAWAPKSYGDHFHDTNFTHRDLAVAAYERAPAEYRAPFDALIEEMNLLVLDGIGALEAMLADGDTLTFAEKAGAISSELQQKIDLAGAIINGHAARAGSEAIDTIINE